MTSRKGGPVREASQAVHAGIQQDHQLITGLLDDLRETDDLGHTAALLDSLADVLGPHFADEESESGLFATLRARRPAADTRLNALALEHGQILESLEKLRRRVRKAQRPSEISAQTSELLQVIRSHERAENLLMTDVYYTDEGGSG